MTRNSVDLPFVPSPELTLGVEIELQLVDRVSRDLSPAAPQVLDRVAGASRNIKPEFFQSMIEVSTGICANAGQARLAPILSRGTVIGCCIPTPATSR